LSPPVEFPPCFDSLAASLARISANDAIVKLPF
jgi:hypothetical protein